MQLGTLAHLGTAATTTTDAATLATVIPTGFTEGLAVWKSPATAIKSLTGIGGMYAVNGLAYTAGYLMVPVAAVVAVLAVMGSTKRRWR